LFNSLTLDSAFMGKRKRSDSDEIDNEISAPRQRTLQDMLDGDIPELESEPAKIRYLLRKSTI
jgi:hypothetical protein